MARSSASQRTRAHLSMKIPASVLAVLSALLILSAPSRAWGWAEAGRVTVPDVSKPGTFPTLPPDVTGELANKVDGKPASDRLRAMTAATPVAIDIDASGTPYVLSVTPSVEVVDKFGITLYEAALLTVRRIAADGSATELKTFLTQSEGGWPSAFDVEPGALPAGLAIDRGLNKMYVSVPGEGINALSLTSGLWTRFVSDDHVFISGEDGLGSDTGESAEDGTYGSLWENGPTAPGAIGVNQATHRVYVADAGAGAATIPVDRINYDAAVVREFEVDGSLVETLPFDAPRTANPLDQVYPTTDGRVGGYGPVPTRSASLLGLDLGASDDLRNRIPRIVARGTTIDGEVTALNQVALISRDRFGTPNLSEDYLGQIASARRSGGGPWAYGALTATADTRYFGPSRSNLGPGVQDLVISKRGNYLVIAFDSPALSDDQDQLLEIQPDGTVLGGIGPATGSSACRIAFRRAHLATDPSGDVVVLQAPDPASATSKAQVIRLNPSGADAPGNPQGCQTSVPPEEVKKTAPTVSVAGVEFSGKADAPTPIGTLAPIDDGGRVVIDADSESAGFMFSVRAEDADNGAAPIGSAATCTIIQVGGATTRLPWRSCRLAIDGGTESSLQLIVLKEALDSLPGATQTFQIDIVDDDSGADVGTASFRFSVQLRKPEKPLTASLTGDAVSRDTFTFAPSVPLDVNFDSWRLDFGDGATPASQPDGDGYSTDQLPARSTAVKFTPGAHTASLTLRRDNGQQFTTKVDIVVDAPTTDRPVTTPRPQGGAACSTPLGIPLSQLGLGDQTLCVPADPCDIDTAELGLTRLPIERPASCAGDDAGFTASGQAAPPQVASRPVFLARTLKLAWDRTVGVPVRCGTGPTACAGRVKIQLITRSSSTRTLGSSSFAEVGTGKRKTIKVKVSATLARQLRRTGTARVKVTVTPSAPTGFTKPRSDVRTVSLSAPTKRKR